MPVRAHIAHRGAWLLAVLLTSTACGQVPDTSIQIAVRTRAAQLLDELRAGRWIEAAEFVTADKVTRERMGIPEGADPHETREEIAVWFRTLYESVPPGVVHSVEISSDPTFALVTYRAGDLDAFYMRLVDGEWYYTLQSSSKHE